MLTEVRHVRIGNRLQWCGATVEVAKIEPELRNTNRARGASYWLTIRGPGIHRGRLHYYGGEVVNVVADA